MDLIHDTAGVWVYVGGQWIDRQANLKRTLHYG